MWTWAAVMEYGWWWTAPIGSASVGLLATTPFVLALRRIDMPMTDAGMQVKESMRILGSAVVLGALTVSSIHDSVESRRGRGQPRST